MNDQSIFKRIAAISAIVAMLLQLIFLFISLLAIDFNPEVMADQSQIIALGDRAARLIHWSEIPDILGFYLLLVPPALYLRRWLSFRGPDLVNLFAVFGLGSLFLGATNAAIRFGALTEMMHAYAQAIGAERETLAIISKVLIDVNFLSLSTLEIACLGIWLLGSGLMLRSERRAFGLFTTILSIAYLGSLTGSLFQIDILVMLLTGVIVPIFPIWTLWLGIVIWRRDEQDSYVQEPAAAG